MTSAYLERPLRTLDQATIDINTARFKRISRTCIATGSKERTQATGAYATDLHGAPKLWDEAWPAWHGPANKR
jgi:hypothetical protein